MVVLEAGSLQSMTAPASRTFRFLNPALHPQDKIATHAGKRGSDTAGPAEQAPAMNPHTKVSGWRHPHTSRTAGTSRWTFVNVTEAFELIVLSGKGSR